MRRARAIFVLGLVALCVLPGVARADTAPHLVAAYPYNGANLPSAQVQNFTATYDRDILGPPVSNVRIVDGTGVPVRGDTALSGPASATGGKRSITFTPATPFRESAGEYHVEVFAVDTGGSGTAGDAIRFRIDDTAPLVPNITTPPQLAHVKRSFLIEGDTTPFALVRISGQNIIVPDKYADERGHFIVSATADDAIHAIWATATDGAGNESAPSSTRTFTVDGAPPAPPVIATPANGSVVRSTNFTVGGTAEPGSTVAVRDRGALKGSTSADINGNWQTGISLADDHYTLTADATDLSGNTSDPSSVSITVDASLGAPVVTTPLENALIASHAVHFAGTSAPGWTVHLSENGSLLRTAVVAADGTWSADLTLAEGLRKIDVQAFNGTDVTGTTRRTVTIDTIGPLPPEFKVPTDGGVIRAQAAHINGSTEPGATLRVFEGAVQRLQLVALSTGLWGAEITLASGPHTFTAYATDRAGNPGQTRTITFTVDGTKPTVTVLTPDLTVSATSSLRIDGSAHDDDVIARVDVKYRDPVRGLVLTEPAVLSALGVGDVDWVARGVALRPGLYTAEVIAYDRSGNYSVSKFVRIVKVQ